MRRLALAVVATVAIGACLPSESSRPSPTPSATGVAPSASPGATGLVAIDMTRALQQKALPYADSFELVRTMKGRDGTPSGPFQPVRTTPPDENVGSASEFWVYDFAQKKNIRITATLRRMTASAKWWVQNDLVVDDAALMRSAQVFQDRIYPTNRRIFGEEWSPGIDGDPRVNILVARLIGTSVAGYFGPNDEVPRWVNEFSAEREMLYMNALASRVGTDNFHAVLSHEFCHMQQFARRVRSAVWFNEGFAQLCERANEFLVGFEQLFLRQPDTQLDAWSDVDDANTFAHYGAAYLFLEYLRHRTGGGFGFMNELVGTGIDTLSVLDVALRKAGHPPVEELFADFVAANALIGASPEAKYAYPADLRLREPARPTSQDRVAIDSSHRASVHQQAARYISLPTGSIRISFDGVKTTRVIATDPHSGASFWWSDRADGLDSRLTREIDLGGARTATLRFWAWYDIEPDFDYAYVAVSTDGGKRWATLAAGSTTTSDPNGNNLGHGFTGKSGGGMTAVWTEQRVDLSPYAGKKVLLRFEHVTDGAVNEAGFAIDDIEIAEVGYRDDAEKDNAWDAKGFIRSTNIVRQRYVVQVIRSGAVRPTVERHVVEDGTLTLEIDSTGDRTPPVLAVSALAPRTTETAAFGVQISARR